MLSDVRNSQWWDLLRKLESFYAKDMLLCCESPYSWSVRQVTTTVKTYLLAVGEDHPRHRTDRFERCATQAGAEIFTSDDGRSKSLADALGSESTLFGDGWTCGLIDRWTDGSTDKRTDGWTVRRTNGQTNGRTDSLEISSGMGIWTDRHAKRMNLWIKEQVLVFSVFRTDKWMKNVLPLESRDATIIWTADRLLVILETRNGPTDLECSLLTSLIVHFTTSLRSLGWFCSTNRCTKVDSSSLLAGHGDVRREQSGRVLIRVTGEDQHHLGWRTSPLTGRFDVYRMVSHGKKTWSGTR